MASIRDLVVALGWIILLCLSLGSITIQVVQGKVAKQSQRNSSLAVASFANSKAQIIPGTFAIVIDQITQEAASRQGFTSQALQGCQEVIKGLPGFNCKYIFRTPSDEIQNDEKLLYDYLLGQITSDQAIRQVTLMGFRFKDVMFKLAAQLPEIFFSIIDSPIAEPFPKNCQGVTFAEDEAGFLAGVVAGAISKSNTVAVIGGVPVEPVQRLVYGFLKGVKFNNPDTTVLGMFVNDPTFSNKALGIAAADRKCPFPIQFVSQKADVIFGAGGSMGSAGIYRGAQLGAWAIGVDIDESTTTFGNKSDPYSSQIFTSALKRVDKAISSILSELLNRGFQPGNRVMDLQSDSLGLAECSSPKSCDYKSQTTFIQDSDPANPSCSASRPILINDLINQMTGKVKVHAITTKVQGGMAQTALSTSNGTWSKIQYFGFAPQGLQAHTQSVISDNQFLFFGGQLLNGSISNTLYQYSLDMSIWTPVIPTTPVSPPRVAYHSAVFKQSPPELVVYGGQSETTGLAPGDSSVQGTVWRFKWDTKEWIRASTTNNGPGFRTKQAYALLEKSLYVWGGQDENFSVRDDFWQLNLDSFAWTKITPPPNTPRPEARFSATLTPQNGTLYLFGGNDGNNDGSTLWNFSPVTGLWAKVEADTTRFDGTDAPSAPMISNHVGVAIDDRRILYVGGLSATTAQAEARIYNVGTNRWELDPKLNLPDGLQGMTAVAVRQSSAPDACEFPNSQFQICKPMDRKTVLIYGGSKRVKGVVSDLLIVDPADEIPPRPLRYVKDSILAIGHVAAAVGILFSLIAIGATVLLRQNMAFKTASPIFLSLYAIGSALANTGIIFYNLPVDPMRCQIGVWLLSEGCMLLFSAMVVKNWRIYFIFYKSMNMRNAVVIKNQVLLSYVAVLVVVNTVVLTAFTILSPFKMTTIVVELDQWPVCGSDNIDRWLWILMAPIVLVLLYGLYISFGTRNVTSKYKESSQINLSIYVTVISLVVLVPLTLTIRAPPTLHIISSLLICLTLQTVIGSNFFTKIFTTFVRDDDPLKFDSMIADNTEETLCCRHCMQPLKAGMMKEQSSSRQHSNLRRRSKPFSAISSRASKHQKQPTQPPSAASFQHHQDHPQPQRKQSRVLENESSTISVDPPPRRGSAARATSPNQEVYQQQFGRGSNMSPVKSIDRGVRTRRSGSIPQGSVDYEEVSSQYGQNFMRSGRQGSVPNLTLPPGTVESSWKVLTKDGVEV
ncbi:hypothetical protein HDU97_007265 [Phlyctochytrium planicorne]|nr:hypothetical protein HDU97_007265 [Phlyctochytrium planicorne]